MNRGGKILSCEVELAQLRHLLQHLEQQLPLVLVQDCCAFHPSIVSSHLQSKMQLLNNESAVG